MKKIILSVPFRFIAFVICIASMISVSIFGTGLVMHLTGGVGNTTFLDRYSSYNYTAFFQESENLLQNIVCGGYVDYFYGPISTNARFIVQERQSGKVVFDTTEDSGITPWYKICLKAYVSDTVDGHKMAQIVAVDEDVNEENVYVVVGYIDTTFPIFDKYSEDFYFLKFRYDVSTNITFVVMAFSVSVLVMISSFVFLVIVAGRKSDGTARAEAMRDKIPFDLILVLSISTIILMIGCLIDGGTRDELLKLISTALTITVGCGLFVGISMTFASRVKNGRFLKNNIIYIVLKFIFDVVKIILGFIGCLPFVLRSVAIVVVGVIVDLLILIFAMDALPFAKGFWIMVWVIKTLVFTVAAIYVAIMMYRLKKGGEALAKGDFNYKTDTSLFLLDFKKHGENLNSVSEGMSEAIESRMRSEKMKTELITNVSHDLKTPLTSIINYSELIAKEECDSEKHREYSDVILRKSKHLKRLLDDLIEVSKATSGNMDVSLSRLDAVILLNQLSGEFEDKIKENGLQLVVTQPEGSVFVMADERRIWRVFENLMNNACKYSLKGSRVYVALKEREDSVEFSFKNTSSAELNISAEELKERFVRGDSSRSTEGSGLGLSIASTFTDIQNGEFEIIIDGDLFRVDVTLCKG